MFHFYFQIPSVTDWLMAICATLSVLITAIGTYYIVKTFRHNNSILALQQKTSQDQSGMLELAKDEERLFQMPIFKIRNMAVQDGQMIQHARFSLKVEGKVAFNLQIVIPDNNQFKVETTDPINNVHIGDEIIFNMTVSEQRLQGEAQVVTIKFSDIKKRLYTQTIFSDGFDYRISLPISFVE